MSQEIQFTNMQNDLYSFIYGEHVDSIEQVQEIRNNIKTYKSFTVYAKLQCELMFTHSAEFEGISKDIQKELWEDIVNAQDGKGLLNLYNVLKEDIEACIQENKEEDNTDETEDHLMNMMRRKAIVLKSIKNREMW